MKDLQEFSQLFVVCGHLQLASTAARKHTRGGAITQEERAALLWAKNLMAVFDESLDRSNKVRPYDEVYSHAEFIGSSFYLVADTLAERYFRTKLPSEQNTSALLRNIYSVITSICDGGERPSHLRLERLNSAGLFFELLAQSILFRPDRSHPERDRQLLATAFSVVR